MELSPVDEIKNRLDVAEVIGSYIKLEKAGRNYRARCPFHSERTPSFMVSTERQIWHCFGCNAGGDIFAFVKQIEGIEFGDALRILAQRAGVVLKRQNPAIQSQRKRLYEICELATKFFEKQLDASKAGADAKKYLIKERGVTVSSLKQWRLGWAPDDWHSLFDFLEHRGYKDNEILNSGLIVSRDAQSQTSIDRNRKFYDRFRSRIMFPLFDIQGQAVGFAGRIFGKEDQPSAGVGKYINTPQTILYDKSRILYGLNFAKTEIRQANAAILVEGNLDVLMSHQAGVKNALATSGTALTPEHLKIIRRYTENILASFDADPAGDSATRRAIALAMENDFNVKIILPLDARGKTAKDPADLIKQNPKTWQAAVQKAVSVIDYYFSSTFARFNSEEADGKKQIAKSLLPVIKKIPNKIEQAHWIAELAKRLKTDEKIIYAELQKIKNDQPFERKEDAVGGPAKEDKPRSQELQARLLSLLLNYPEKLKNLNNLSKNIDFGRELGEILKELESAVKKAPEKEKCLKIIKKRLPQGLAKQVDFVCLQLDRWPTEESVAEKEIQSCIRELKIIQIKEKMINLGFEIQNAQNQNSPEKLEKNMKKFKELSNELIEITKTI